MELDDKQEFDFDFQMLAGEWYASLSPTAFTPHSYVDVRDRLAAMAAEATKLLYEDTYRPADAERIGVALAELHYVQGDALGISIKVLSNAWLGKIAAGKQDINHQRMTMLLGDLTNGYFKAATRTILHHQETMREAQLTSLRELHTDLQHQGDLLRITAERLQTLHDTEKRARRESETLREVAASLSSSLEREELLDNILVQLHKVVPYDGAVILLQTEVKLQVVAQRGINHIAIESLNNLDELPPNMRRLIAQRTPLIVSDTHKDLDWLIIPGSDLERCWLGAPLISQGIFVGLLGLSKNEPNYYQQSAAELVLAFANHAAVAIENSRLYHEVQRNTETLRDKIAARTRDLESLYEIAAVTGQPLDLQTILKAGLQRTIDHLRCKSGSIHILNQNDGVLNLVEHHNLNSNQIEHIQQDDTNSWLLQKFLVEQQTIVTSDTSADPRLHIGMPPHITASYAGTPMRARGKVHGVLSLYCPEVNDFTDDDIKLFASIADHLGNAIDNAHLQKQAQRAAVIGERERLARDLHDSATQSLFSLTLFAAAAREKVQSGQPDRALQHLNDIRHTANQTHREMRLLLHELGSTEPAEEGLTKALERRLRAVEGRSGIKATFRPLCSCDLDAEVEQALYQMATEALNNALKYASGTHVDVEINCDDTDIILSVKDNGLGFDLSEARKGAGRGLTNMALRAAGMGGKLSIKTSIRQGSEIIAQIPRN